MDTYILSHITNFLSLEEPNPLCVYIYILTNIGVDKVLFRLLFFGGGGELE